MFLNTVTTLTSFVMHKQLSGQGQEDKISLMPVGVKAERGRQGNVRACGGASSSAKAPQLLEFHQVW